MEPQTGNLPAPAAGTEAAVSAPLPAAPAPSVPAAPVLARRPKRRVPVLADGEHSFEAVQHKLRQVSQAMATATKNLARIDRRLLLNAAETDQVADHIGASDLDAVFVELTQEVARAQTEAAQAARRVLEAAREAHKAAVAAQRTHLRMYAALDRVRRGRKHRTPKPGFFVG